MAKRAAQGSGTIRKKTITRNGKQYTYWEARYTIGADPGTGKQIQKSITGKTQKEVREKLQAIETDISNGTYQDPSKMTVSEWLAIWQAEYLQNVKTRTLESYRSIVKTYLVPNLGAERLQRLTPHKVQQFYNNLQRRQKPLSPKTISNVHGVLHKAMQQAQEIGYIRANPTTVCKLPRVQKPDIKPLDSDMISKFLEAIHGHEFENIFRVTLFTGMREGEVLGLAWDCVDFEHGTITIKRQLQRDRINGTGAYLETPKNGKSRTISPAASVMRILQQERGRQAERRLYAGQVWNNPLNLVFTNEVGRYLSPQTVYKRFKQAAASIGMPDARFHDLRHSYAVAALRAGDDVKTVQGNLGHHTAAFTLDVYGHVTEQMKRDSAERMEQFIKCVSDL